MDQGGRLYSRSQRAQLAMFWMGLDARLVSSMMLPTMGAVPKRHPSMVVVCAECARMDTLVTIVRSNLSQCTRQVARIFVLGMNVRTWMAMLNGLEEAPLLKLELVSLTVKLMHIGGGGRLLLSVHSPRS